MTTALVITAAGINCDGELRQAFRLAGCDVEDRHLSELLDDPGLLDRFDLIGLPGGFSYGDAVAAGRIAAQLIRRRLYPSLVQAIERGVPIIAPCNGFQIAAQVGLLPGPAPGEPWPAEPPRPTISLAANTSARFVDRWTRIEVPPETRCVWTRDLALTAETALLPVAHGEGRLVLADDAMLDELASRGQVAVRYASDDNPNGSVGDVAGLCDASGLVFGLMPHPERYTRWTQHPWWTRLASDSPHEAAGPPGLQMFQSAVRHAAAAPAR